MRNKTKLVCVTSRVMTLKTVEKQFVNSRYLRPLHERGFNTLLLTLENKNTEEVLDLCDGFLITGGDDLDPSNYNETNEEGLSKDVDKIIDLLDKKVIEHAKKHKKPLLGICRGIQSLNVFLGGSLIQDLGEKNEAHNRVLEDHIVKITPGNKFNIKEDFNVNSYHHQAINKVADELEVIGVHTDGTVEMVAHKTLPMVAVEWHPEIRADSKESKLIFDIFRDYLNKEK